MAAPATSSTTRRSRSANRLHRGVLNGYATNYNYDDRLANILPPYPVDISNSGWRVSHETLCTAGSTNTATGSQAPG